jgi:hypothetical protein
MTTAISNNELNISVPFRVLGYVNSIYVRIPFYPPPSIDLVRRCDVGAHLFGAGLIEMLLGVIKCRRSVGDAIKACVRRYAKAQRAHENSIHI